MAYYRHVWLVGPDGICPPLAIGYFDRPNATVAPSHGDTTDENILTDGDDGTWIDFTSSIYAANPDFHDNVGITFDHVYTGTINPPSSAELAIYYKADQDFRFVFREDPALPRLAWADAYIGVTTTDASPLGAGWRKARLNFETGWDHASIVALFEHNSGPGAAGGWRFEIHPPEATDDVTTIEDYPSQIIEVRIAYATQVVGAPPCRLFPREDGLGVGGGRRFPPPKSQQASSRRVGYY